MQELARSARSPAPRVSRPPHIQVRPAAGPLDRERGCPRTGRRADRGGPGAHGSAKSGYRVDQGGEGPGTEKSQSSAGRTRQGMKAIEAQHRVGSDLKRPGGAPRWPGVPKPPETPPTCGPEASGGAPKRLRVLEISGNVPRGEAGCSRIWRPSSQVAQGQQGRRRGNSPSPCLENSGAAAGPSRSGGSEASGSGPRGRCRRSPLLFSPVQCTIALIVPVASPLSTNDVLMSETRPRSAPAIGAARAQRPGPRRGRRPRRDRSLTGTRGTGLLVARLPILATAGQRALRRQVRRRPGQPGAGTQAPGLRRAPRRPAGGQQQQQQQERPRARRRRRRPGLGGSRRWGRGPSGRRRPRPWSPREAAAGPAAGRRGRERPRPGERRRRGSAGRRRKEPARGGRRQGGGTRRSAAAAAQPRAHRHLPASRAPARASARRSATAAAEVLGRAPPSRGRRLQPSVLKPCSFPPPPASCPPAPSSESFLPVFASTYSGRAKCQALGITA